MDGHLVAVEVGVEGGADQRVKLNGPAVYEHRLERLDAETVERRGAVEQHRAVLDHLFEDVPDLGANALGHALGALDIVCVAFHDESIHDERFEQLQGHAPGQSALVESEVRPCDDDRAAGVVHTLAEQVLPEAPLLAPEKV